MPIGTHNRSPALGTAFAFRRIFPNSTFWKPPPDSRATSIAYKDPEMSVDIYPDDSPSSFELVRNKNLSFLEIGFGLSHAQVEKIRESLRTKEIVGDVMYDPLPDNLEHGVVTGTPADKKGKALQPIFLLMSEPNFEVYIEHQKRLKEAEGGD